MNVFHELTSKADELHGLEEARIKNNKRQIKLYPEGSDATAGSRALLEEAERATEIIERMRPRIRLIRHLLKDHIPPNTGFDKSLNVIHGNLEHCRYDKHLHDRLGKLTEAEEVIENLIPTIKKWFSQQAGAEAHV
jgi:hypothetical protein